MMFKIGIIGTENSHAREFANIFNKPNENGEYAFPDCRVTLVWGHFPEESERVVRECGAERVASGIEEMVASVDAVMITARDGKYHTDFARPFVEAGIPAFVDKPFCTDPAEALSLARLAKEKGVPLCGGSSLKYAAGILEMKAAAEASGDKLHAGHVSAPLMMVNDYSGFWFYSAHLAEMCMEVFGWEPREVVAVENGGSVSAIVSYDGYSVACNFTNDCGDSYSVSVFGEKTNHKAINLDGIFRAECEVFVKMLRTGEMAHSYEQLIAPVSFLDAIKRSYETKKAVAIDNKPV
ncbi:MAG: Gfo/Idh/MocA family oxidoreductase [Clostridia bacterium]|nr:Gfo/Idh/MocA family oxidoreductase [Clostridia bacterium]